MRNWRYVSIENAVQLLRIAFFSVNRDVIADTAVHVILVPSVEVCSDAQNGIRSLLSVPNRVDVASNCGNGSSDELRIVADITTALERSLHGLQALHWQNGKARNE